MELTIFSDSPQKTIRYGSIIGRVAVPGSVIGLTGELGTGKTCFIKGLVAAIAGVSEQDVASPTFTFLQEFPGSIPVYHFDLYRIKEPAELDDLGFYECLYGTGVTVIEWAERAAGALPAERFMIYLAHVDECRRRITLSASGERYITMLQRVIPVIEGGR